MELTKTDKIRLFQQMTGWSVDKMRANKKQINALLNDESISFIEQELTEEQKAQARTNINAGDAETVQELDEKVNGTTIQDWIELENVASYPGILRGSATNNMTINNSSSAAASYYVRIFELHAGRKYRIHAQKPVARTGPTTYYTAYYGYSSVVLQNGTLRDVYADKVAGELVDYIIENDTDRYIYICGRLNYGTLKCEIFGDIHTPGLEECVEGLKDGAPVFVEYDVTKYSEIAKLAANWNRLVLCGHSGRIYMLKEFNETHFVFICITRNENVDPPQDCTYAIFVTSQDIWYDAAIPLNSENSQNKVQTLEDNESDEAKYPSTKAVANALATTMSLDSLDELLSTLGTAMNGTFEKVWDDVNKKYTFTFTPGT